MFLLFKLKKKKKQFFTPTHIIKHLDTGWAFMHINIVVTFTSMCNNE